MSGGKEAKWRAELDAAQKAYRQQAAKEERQKNRIAARDIALDKCMRALQENKIYIGKAEPLKAAKGHMDPKSATISLTNSAIREIEKARDS